MLHVCNSIHREGEPPDPSAAQIAPIWCLSNQILAPSKQWSLAPVDPIPRAYPWNPAPPNKRRDFQTFRRVPPLMLKRHRRERICEAPIIPTPWKNAGYFQLPTRPRAVDLNRFTGFHRPRQHQPRGKCVVRERVEIYPLHLKNDRIPITGHFNDVP